MKRVNISCNKVIIWSFVFCGDPEIFKAADKRVANSSQRNRNLSFARLRHFFQRCSALDRLKFGGFEDSEPMSILDLFHLQRDLSTDIPETGRWPRGRSWTSKTRKVCQASAVRTTQRECPWNSGNSKARSKNITNIA